MYKVSVCGHFGQNEELLNGQTIKTKNIYNALVDTYGKNEINIIDSHNWKERPIKFLFKCVNGIRKSNNVIMLPAHNGVKVFVPLFTNINYFYKRKIVYIVIGGWLPEFLENRKILLKKMKRINKIFVETRLMKSKLNEMGLKNVEILPNFKDIEPIKENELKIEFNKPYKLCTFSRVMKEKGIEDAIEVVKQINEEQQEIMYTLDIYGQIDKNYEDRFNEIMKNVPDYIQYKGCIDSNKSVETIKNYYFLLFPTKFKTEGIPGTIIDAYFAGVPVISAEWENANEIIDDGVTRLYL